MNFPEQSTTTTRTGFPTTTRSGPSMRAVLPLLFFLGVCSVVVNISLSNNYGCGDHDDPDVMINNPQQTDTTTNNNNNRRKRRRPGVMVLGMHRSGTSLLTGLLHTTFGYQVGGPLLPTSPENPKGFFERKDFFDMNVHLFHSQNVTWFARVDQFNHTSKVAYRHLINQMKPQGPLDFMTRSSPRNVPWIQKDPRHCITLMVWRQLLEPFDIEPAIVFTYRHPLEVARSLYKRNKYTLRFGLQLWMDYNRLSIQNSKGLCIVYTSNNAILEHPLEEAQRISNELTTKCHVPKPPHGAKTDNPFVDPKLQSQNQPKKHKALQEQKQDLVLLAEHNNGDCPVHKISDSQFGEGTPERGLETKTYLAAMKVYCDLQSGKAYEENYEWPPRDTL